MCLSSGAGLDKAIGCFDAAVQVCFLPSKIMYIGLRPLLCDYSVKFLIYQKKKKNLLCRKYEMKNSISTIGEEFKGTFTRKLSVLSCLCKVGV